MPHLVVQRIAAIKTPIEKDGLIFEFMSDSAEGFGERLPVCGEAATLSPRAIAEGVIGVKSVGARFLLRYFPHEKGAIIKVDKATRPPFLSEIQRSMLAFAELCGAEIVDRNFGEPKIEKPRANLCEPHDFAANLDRDKPLWIEVGFGSGRHILKNAAAAPEAIHLGVEIHRPSAEQLSKRAEAEKLPNIFVALTDARAMLAALPSGSCERIFIHFPIPWDKSPSRRVYNEEFVRSALRVLKKGGSLELRTDSDSYFERSLEIARRFESAAIETKENAEAVVSSKYEDRWRRMGKRIYDLKLTNLRESSDAKSAIDFAFPPQKPNLSANLSDLPPFSESFLLKFKERWQLTNKGFLMRLIIGDPLAPQIIYLLTRDDSIEYYPAEPLPTPQNGAAHRAVLSLLYAR